MRFDNFQKRTVETFKKKKKRVIVKFVAILSKYDIGVI